MTARDLASSIGTLTRKEGLAYLTQCADDNGDHWSAGLKYAEEDCPTCRGTNDAGWLRVPCSRYGSTSEECAPVAWRFAYLMARETGEDITREDLHWAMGLVVNDHDDVAYMVRNYGHRMYQ